VKIINLFPFPSVTPGHRVTVSRGHSDLIFRALRVRQERNGIWVKDNSCLKDGSLSHSCRAHVTRNLNRCEWDTQKFSVLRITVCYTHCPAHAELLWILLCLQIACEVIWRQVFSQVFVFGRSAFSEVFVYPVMFIGLASRTGLTVWVINARYRAYFAPSIDLVQILNTLVSSCQPPLVHPHQIFHGRYLVAC
jgi:hypothetical protein